MKTYRTPLILTSLLVAVCYYIYASTDDEVEIFDNLVSQYEESNDSDDANIAINYYAYSISTSTWISEEAKSKIIPAMSRLSDLALKNGDYETFLRSKSFYSTPSITDDQYAIVEKKYNGNEPAYHLRIAGWLSNHGRYKSAYTSLLKAADLDHYYTAHLVHMLEHFGCMDTAAIWGELLDNGSGELSGIKGAKYPEQPFSLSVEEVVNGRVLLRKGTHPKLQENCPIHLFD